ncbi:DMT family transporter [Robertmurraya andreesenii]|uniref:Drug/metabolite transporter (DMT)-like permease n=1 Tax=Anoxybacillus andreesenii TaxID=1325932 RepID=A0ABT9V2K1_9BACL|nr:EamA family transporter [Robertmurraya andreesenii]MDQ0155159.1 drug/metabolite transporter (DMT)-like permease [Robertmurraya andreesenii]
MKKLLPYLMIAFGASLWGLIAIFVRELKDAGLTEMEIVTVRVAFASLFLLLIGGIRYRSQFAIELRKLPLFFGTGICSIVFFNYCYFSAINQMNISIAVILLYTSPAFVTILSYLFLKEPLHKRKIGAVMGTIIGCVLIAGMSTGATSNITLVGVLTGLGAGLGYALYSIFGKFALEHYKPFTVTLYTFIVATVVLLPFSSIWGKLDLLLQSKVLLISASLGLIPTVLAYFVYTWGLEKTESSKAAIIATVEPVVATLVGIVVYQEKMGFVQFLGALLILMSVIMVNLPGKAERLASMAGTNKKSTDSVR